MLCSPNVERVCGYETAHGLNTKTAKITKITKAFVVLVILVISVNGRQPVGAIEELVK